MTKIVCEPFSTTCNAVSLYLIGGEEIRMATRHSGMRIYVDRDSEGNYTIKMRVKCGVFYHGDNTQDHVIRVTPYDFARIHLYDRNDSGEQVAIHSNQGFPPS